MTAAAEMATPEHEPPRAGESLGLVVLFVVYLALLVWIVLWKLDVPWVGGGALRLIELVPFQPGGGAGAAPFEVAVNFALFVPFGLYLGLIVPSWPWWTVAGAAIGASSALEVTQYVLAVGSSDVTDVVVNAAGGLAGLGLVTLARRRFQEATPAAKTRVCLIGTVLALLAIGIFIASPLRYGPRESKAAAPASSPATVSGAAGGAPTLRLRAGKRPPSGRSRARARARAAPGTARCR